jgi:hypothetical protein
MKAAQCFFIVGMLELYSAKICAIKVEKLISPPIAYRCEFNQILPSTHGPAGASDQAAQRISASASSVVSNHMSPVQRSIA